MDTKIKSGYMTLKEEILAAEEKEKAEADAAAEEKEKVKVEAAAKDRLGEHIWPLILQFLTLCYLPIWAISFAISWVMHEANALDDALSAISVGGFFLVMFCAIPFGITGLICTVTMLKKHFRFLTATSLLSIANIILGAVIIYFAWYAGSHF